MVNRETGRKEVMLRLMNYYKLASLGVPSTCSPTLGRHRGPWSLYICTYPGGCRYSWEPNKQGIFYNNASGKDGMPFSHLSKLRVLSRGGRMPPRSSFSLFLRVPVPL